MNLYYLLAVLVVALLVAVVIAGVRGGAAERRSMVGDRADPTGRQQAILARLADLEFEYQTGKIGEEEYLEQKAPLAKAALQARAELEGSGPARGVDRGDERDSAT
ncbi:MAG: hypothetical protein P8Y10_10100 [Gemmatimonadales bacterium]